MIYLQENLTGEYPTGHAGMEAPLNILLDI